MGPEEVAPVDFWRSSNDQAASSFTVARFSLQPEEYPNIIQSETAFAPSVKVKATIPWGDVENRTGLLRCYISRVENGHTVPAIETLEKFARALEVPIYQLFYGLERAPG